MTIDGEQAIRVETDEERSWRWTLWAIFALTAVRLIWLTQSRTDLYPDEAQYWIWSLTPDWGYFSKPPLVAWIIALTTKLLGDSEAAIRLGAPLLHFGTSLVLFWIARRLFDPKTAFWSALVYATLPGVSLSSAIISTDAPLLFCWAVALLAFIRARETDDKKWWLAVGVAVGVGLLAKYAMAYWLLSALIFLALFREERRHIPYLIGAAALALLIYSPNFWWNYQHGFVSYAHTGGNANLKGTLGHPEHLLAFFGSQFGVFGPLLFGALIVLVAVSGRAFGERRLGLLACFALPTLVLVLILSFLSHAEPNWAAPAFVAATPLVVSWLRARKAQRLVLASVILHLVIAVIMLEGPAMADAAGYDLPAKYNPLARLKGWRPLGRSVSYLLQQNPGVTLMTDDRELTAALIYYVEPHPFDAFKWNGEGKVSDQFDMRADPKAHIGENFLLVARYPDNLKRIFTRFAEVGPPGHIIIPLGGGESREFAIYLLKGFKGYREGRN